MPIRIEKNIHLERHTTAESVIWNLFSMGNSTTWGIKPETSVHHLVSVTSRQVSKTLRQPGHHRPSLGGAIFLDHFPRETHRFPHFLSLAQGAVEGRAKTVVTCRSAIGLPMKCTKILNVFYHLVI